MKKIIILTAQVAILLTIAAIGMFLTFGDCASLSLFIWTKVLAVPTWLIFAAAAFYFDRDGQLTSQLPREFLADE